MNCIKAILLCLCLLVALPFSAQTRKKEEWRPPKRTKVKWKAPKEADGDPVLDIWKPYTIADNWWIDMYGGIGKTFGENGKGHGMFGAMGAMGGLALGRQTSYLWSTRFAMEYALQHGWAAKGNVKLPLIMGKGKYDYKTFEMWLDERVSLTNAFCPYDESRLLNIQAFAGLGVNYATGASDETKLWEQVNYGEYTLDRYTTLNLAVRTGVQAQYIISPAMDLWAQAAVSFIGDKHNAQTHAGGTLEPNLDLTLGLTIYMPDRTFGEARYRRMHHSQALLLRGRNAAVDEYFAREDARREALVQGQRVEPGAIMDIRVAFYVDRVFINEQQRDNVHAVARFMRQHPEVSLIIHGYSGASRHSETQGLNLARRRAEAVQQALVKDCGIDPSRLNVKYDEDARSPQPMHGEWIEAVEFEIVR